MKYAILGDIHSNYEALTTVLEDAQSQGVEKYCCVGDVVGYNANPSECLALIRDIGTITVRGNHDHYCSFNMNLKNFHPLAAEVVDWTRQILTEEERDYLRELPLYKSENIFTIVHSTLDTPSSWGYVFDRLDAESSFAYQTTQICFYGHTHVPMCFEKRVEVTLMRYEKFRVEPGCKYFINVGSVGQPRDGDPRSAYVIYDSDFKTVECRRLAYDIEKTQEKIRRNGLPERLAQRLALGK
ncbi:MAG: metallophosphoesterase [Spartobacteria bacterium]|nr:metallophosphoesterase [Spartobacteria bacterium]